MVYILLSKYKLYLVVTSRWTQIVLIGQGGGFIHRVGQLSDHCPNQLQVSDVPPRLDFLLVFFCFFLFFPDISKAVKNVAGTRKLFPPFFNVFLPPIMRCPVPFLLFLDFPDFLPS